MSCCGLRCSHCVSTRYCQVLQPPGNAGQQFFTRYFVKGTPCITKCIPDSMYAYNDMASLLPGHSSGGSRSKGRSRLSSSAVAADSPYAADIQGLLTSRSDRQEARRRLGRSGKGFVDVSLLDEEEEECSEPDMQVMQLQAPPDSCTRRVTFSAAGGTEQQLVQQQQADQPNPVLLQAARLWRGAAASVCAGQRLQSLERHAAELKQRQEIHTELKAWVEQVLSQPQEELLDPAQEDAFPNAGHAVLSDGGQQQQQQQQHHRHHQHHRHSQQLGLEGAEDASGVQDAAAGGGGHHRRRKSSHRHKRHSHKHHQQAAAEGLDCAAQQGSDSDAAVGGQAGAEGVAAGGTEAQNHTAALEPAEVPSVQQGREQWHQFNAAEQQLIAQMQQDQQQLINQLQQAYQQIAALTAAQEAAEAAAAAATAAAPVGGQQQQQQQHADVALHPAPDTQVLVITRKSNASQGDQGQQHTLSLRNSTDMQEDPEQQGSQTVQPTAPTTGRRSSICSSPRARRTSTAAAGTQAASSPRTPRAAGRAAKATAAGTGSAGANSKVSADTAAPATPRESLQAAAAAKSKGRVSLPVPQGRALTLPQQQALLQRLQQAEEVMELLQQDLQESLQAQQPLQEQCQQLQGPGCAEGCAEPCADRGQVSDPQQEQLQGQDKSEAVDPATPAAAGAQQERQTSGDSSAQPDAHTWSEQSGVDVAARLLALQQQLQEQLQLSSAAQQELAEAREVSTAQQQQIGDLQQQLLLQQQELEQKRVKYVQQIETLQEQLAGLNTQLQLLQQQQQQQQQELLATNGADASSLQHQPLQDMSPQQLQEMLLQQRVGATAAAADGSMCCRHEARCQQLQSILQALLQQLQAQEAQQHTSCTMRPYTAATQGSPRARATWQHRPVELHTWLYPPLQVARPGTQQSAHIGSQPLQPAAAQGYHRSVSAPRCATASSPRHANWDRMSSRPASPGPKCNTSGALTARYGDSTAVAYQDSTGGCSVLQSLEYRLRPLTYRGPDRATADAIAAATGGRRRLSTDAEKGLLSSLHVAPVSARGRGHMQATDNIAASRPRGAPVSNVEDAELTVEAVGGVAVADCGIGVGSLARIGSGGMCSPGRQRRADVTSAGVQGSSSPRSARGGQGAVCRGVPRLVLGGLH